MQDKRYQVFISSTFEDLREERRAVQDVVITTGDFPVQMESFPAADEDVFEFIKSLIDQCDYYVLIIGGRYGTIADDGLSYTHKEFRYAVSKGVPVLVMLNGQPGKISTDKSEETAAGKKRLSDFISEAERSRVRKNWTTLDGLKLAVREALDHAKATKPRIGWVRGDSIANLETLEELNSVRKENEKFRTALGNLAVEVPLPNIPSADDEVVVDLLPTSISRGFSRVASGSSARIKGTWISMFPIFFSNLKWSSSDWNGEYYQNIDNDASCSAIGAAIAAEIATFDTTNLFKISKTSLERLSSYYIEAGLMTTEGGNPFTESAQRLARRHLINQTSASPFVIVEGEVKVSTTSPADTSHRYEEDIPF